MITVVRPASKEFIGTITNEDYLRFIGAEAMPETYHRWRKAAEAGHANPLFDMSTDPRYWFAAFGKAGMNVSTHAVVVDDFGGYSIRSKDEEFYS